MNDDFSVPDGDIILRTQSLPNRHFRVHKLVLSLASSVFKDMFGMPQPEPDASTVDTEVVDVTDPPQALDLILRLIYPIPPPIVNNLDLLVEGLVITDKYNIAGARARLRMRLAKFVNEDPLRAYAIASRFGFDEEAERASSLTTGIYLPALTDLPDDLKHISAPAYHKLIRLHERYRNEIEDAVDAVLFEPACLECKVAKALAEPRMRTKLVRIFCRGTPITVAAYIRELGIVCKAACMTKFVEGVAVKLGGKNAIILP
ncbi:hypothetical protein BDM02DRAFT_1981589 [Thelephora ganbajun]|uniref:Uncharacterized protein n=1 Tax=Thelephora ganbajun TaxID=370292 RepID=A0ACB6ZHI8_THEGA|nr:hypothetical protein BDM02DRAFT_1981589 [Thelephora ganbajun]